MPGEECGRSSAKLRRSPLTLYCRAGNVTVRAPSRRSQTAKPISLRPAQRPVGEMQLRIGFPGGLPRSWRAIFTVRLFVVVVMMSSLSKPA